MPFTPQRHSLNRARTLRYNKGGPLHSFHPMDFRNNIMAWWDFNKVRDVRYGSSTLISYCGDQSANNRHLVQDTGTNQPDHIVESQGWGYRRTAFFDGNDNFMKAASGVNNWDGTGILGSQNRTIIVAGFLDDDASDAVQNSFIGYGNTAGNAGTRFVLQSNAKGTNGTKWAARVNCASSEIIASTSLKNVSWVLTFALNGTTLNDAVIRFNGVEEAISYSSNPGTTLNTVAGNDAHVGAVDFTGTAGYASAHLTSIICLDVALTNNDLKLMERHFGSVMRVDVT